MHDQCMAVKTITIDLEAYDLLARRKRPGQSFSQVIKEQFGRRKTARDLLAIVRATPMHPSAVDDIEREVRRRRLSRPRVVRL